MSHPILTAIIIKDWTVASSAIGSALQQKVAEHLAQERVAVGRRLVKEDTFQPGDRVRTKQMGQTPGTVTKVENGKVYFELDEPEGKWGKRVWSAPIWNVVKESVLSEDALPIAEVQRIYDETGDVTETETLCNISKLVVNSKGEVVSFVQPDHLSEGTVSESLYGVTRMDVQNAFDRFMSAGYGLQQSIRNAERECGVTNIKLSSDQRNVVFFDKPAVPREF